MKLHQDFQIQFGASQCKEDFNILEQIQQRPQDDEGAAGHDKSEGAGKAGNFFGLQNKRH